MNIDSITTEQLKLARYISKNGCAGINCDGVGGKLNRLACPHNHPDKECHAAKKLLFADLLEAEIKRRGAQENREELNLEIKVEDLDNKTYRSKVTTGCVVVETVVSGLSFEEVKILVDGE